MVEIYFIKMNDVRKWLTNETLRGFYLNFFI